MLKVFFIKDVKQITKTKLKKHIVNIYILDVIIIKLCYWKKPYLVILLIVDKILKISIYIIILFFSLTVSL